MRGTSVMIEGQAPQGTDTFSLPTRGKERSLPIFPSLKRIQWCLRYTIQLWPLEIGP